MHCEISGCQSDELLVLPIHRDDGSLITIACPKCAESSGAYCKQHRCPHQGFKDGTTACLKCIEAEVASVRGQTDYYESLRKTVPRDQFRQLDGWARPAAALTQTSVEEALARFVITAAQRLGTNRMEIFTQVSAGNLKLILPGMI